MARDPRDKIYGLLSLVQERRAGPETCQNIQADYNLATGTLYKGLAERYLTQGAGEFNAKILLYAGVGWPRTVGGLPSWVPDWTSISMAHTRAFATATFYLHWEASTLSKCQKAFSFQGNTLKIAGCHVIDTISAQTQIIDHDDDSRRWFHEICDVVEGQLSYIPTKEIDFLGEWSWCYRRCPGRWRGAIFRVLIGDIKSYWGEVPAHTKVTRFVRPDTFPNVIPGAGYENPNHADPRGGRIELEASYDEWLKLPHRQPKYPGTVEKEHTGCVPFVSLSRRKTQGLRFAVSQTGRMCLVPPHAALGDKVMISEHLRSPYLIRPMKNEKGYQLVGHCIALGLMGDREWNHYNAAMGVNPEGYNLEVCKKEVLTIY
ncbi:het domain-containing protein [Fusarium napiforme]|uniref:Het domain-containing protein n=1 Tax=Fusarium napiforme TaxID=42672 RepID=A0A8H5KAC9_9HYPO|nr:het domain-containing protein [Fusarium napiforme]